MKRGDVVVAVTSGDYGKPRPFLIVQTDALNDTHASILACPITSEVTNSRVRVRIHGGDETGLRSNSEVMVDKLQAVRRDRMGQRIGAAPKDTMSQVEAVLAVLLAL